VNARFKAVNGWVEGGRRRDGETERWRDGEMERWRDEKTGRLRKREYSVDDNQKSINNSSTLSPLGFGVM